MLASRNDSRVRRFLSKASGFFFCLFLLEGCSNDIEKIKFFERKEMPYQVINNANMIRSEAGDLQMIMEAPIIEVYQRPEAKTICPKGVKLHFYDAQGKEKAFLRANYGISYDDRKYMEIKKNVVIIDYRSGDTSYLKDLVWNQGEHRLYSKHSVRSVNGQRVTMGDSFESDENFDNPRIMHQRGTVLFDEDNEEE